jgi:hypothetical protein
MAGAIRKLRLSLAVFLLLGSLTLLSWGLWPSIRERQVLTIPLSELGAATPGGFAPAPTAGK